MRTQAILGSAVAAVMLGFSSGAYAFCPQLPDGADSHYVANGTARAVCLQNELAATTAWKSHTTQVDTTLNRMETDQLQQRLKDLTTAPTLFGYGAAPAWP